mgnify:CR=1 FL=1
MKTMKKLLFLTFAISLFISCSKDDDPQNDPIPTAAYEKGILVTNEGYENLTIGLSTDL